MIRARKSKDGNVSFQLVVYAGLDADGNDEYVRRTLTGVSKREANKVHAQLVVDVQNGRTSPSRGITVEELARQWWDTHAADLSPSTRIGYRQWLDKRVLPKFGRKKISSVTTAEIERWYAELRDGPKPLGARSIRCCRTVLSAMFTAAVRWGYLPSSPVNRARVPRAPKWAPRPSPSRWRCESRPRRRAIRISASLLEWQWRWARRGELAALRWTDVDLERGFVRIATAVVPKDDAGTGIRRGKQLALKDTKTHSERTVALDVGNADGLTRDAQTTRRARAGMRQLLSA